MTITTILLAILTILVAPILFLGWLTEGNRERARRLHRTGWSKAAISRHMGLSPYRVGKLLAA